MNRDPQQSGASGDEESWESLAENLFGIEFRKIPDPGEIVSPEDLEEISLDDLEGTEDAIDADVSADDETVDELTLEISDESSEEETPSGAAAEATKEDTYWDALKDWSWDESEDRGEAGEGDAPARGRGPRRRDDRSGRPQRDQRGSRRDDRDTRRSRPIDPSVVASRDVPTTSDLRDEYVDDSDFGAGLLDEDQTAEPRREPPSRIENRVSSPHVPSDVRPSRESGRDLPDWESKSRREPPAKLDVGEEEEFGADLNVEEEVEEEGGESAENRTEKTEGSTRGPRRRRRRRRRRGSREPEARTASNSIEERRDSLDVEDDVEIIEESAEIDDAEASGASSVGGEAARHESRDGEENRPRRRRRGRRRGRGRDRDDRVRDKIPAEDSTRAFDEDSPRRAVEPVVEQTENWDEDSEEVNTEGDDDPDAVPSYSNVPTWEQAISYLLNPGQAAKERESESGGASSGKPSGEGRRPRRGRGRRR